MTFIVRKRKNYTFKTVFVYEFKASTQFLLRDFGLILTFKTKMIAFFGGNISSYEFLVGLHGEYNILV